MSIYRAAGPFLHLTRRHNVSGITQTGGRPAGSCTAALFLKAFAEGSEAKDGQDARMKWAHIDIAGTMDVRKQLVERSLTADEFLDCSISTHYYIGHETHALHGKRHDGTPD